MFHLCWSLWWPFPGSAHCWEPEGVCELFIQLSVCLFVWTACKYLNRYSPPAIQDIPSGSDQASPSSTWKSWSRSRNWKGNAPPKSYSCSCNLQFAVTVAIYNLHEESLILRMLYFPPKNDQTSHPGQLRALSNDFEKPIPCDLGALADEMNSKTEDGWIMMMGGYGSYNLNFKTCMSSSLSFEQVAMSSTDSSPTLPEPFRLSSNSFGQCLICT